jgi:hypothetical protein
MRNYELIEKIKRICVDGPQSGHGYSTFKNIYLNDIIAINQLIERERPELVGRGGAEECAYDAGEEKAARDLEETRFE